jgi:tetratricopeptide (TPR) repeat protein
MSVLAQARDVHRGVTLHRRKGDALLRYGNAKDAADAYSIALNMLDDVLTKFPSTPSELDEEQTDSYLDIASEAAELWGERGGVLRRLGQLAEALNSYNQGAAFEDAYTLPVTYNRVNALKLSIMTGLALADLTVEINQTRNILERRLATDERATDDAWLWADLGDLRLLLGDVDKALSAYRTFVAKARTDSPGLTLSVLRDVVEALEQNGDPEAQQVRAGAARVERELSS